VTPGKGSKGIVLIADDSTEALGMLNEVLIAEGYTVFAAMDGLQALAIANRIVPDIVLMDAIMPNMDGFQACRELKKEAELCDVPVVFMTGLTDTEHMVAGLEAGGIDYVTKPINMEELLARVKAHMQTARAARSTRIALNEIGQQSFACDINGQIIWTTTSARELFAKTGADADWMERQLPEQVRTWLSHNPQKYSVFRLKGLNKPLQLRFLARPAPNEYLLRVIQDDEIAMRNALQAQFSLTGRESEVLFWLVRGKTNREIGQILSVSPRTVNKHLETIYRKLSVDNRTSATAVCLEFINAH
jgi:DNA-binding response OmpR family regulator/DNA-binding CsgD family transcriptional regulator